MEHKSWELDDGCKLVAQLGRGIIVCSDVGCQCILKKDQIEYHLKKVSYEIIIVSVR